jgi:hypothetical protein
MALQLSFTVMPAWNAAPVHAIALKGPLLFSPALVVPRRSLTASWEEAPHPAVTLTITRHRVQSVDRCMRMEMENLEGKEAQGVAESPTSNFIRLR